MKYHVIKLDRRHSHHDLFKYMLGFSSSNWTGTGVIDFDRSRRWMNKTWGWSQEVTMRDVLLSKKGLPATDVQADDINTHWAYSVEYKDYRIYLEGESELNWFVLSHPNEA